MSLSPALPARARPYHRSRDRRRFLALAATGLVGGLVLRLDREARGAVSAVPRFILYNHANGLQKVHLDKCQVQAPDNFKLASFMTEFEPHQSELTVVQNLYCSTGEYLHGNASSALACADRGPITGGATGTTDIVIGGPSFDQLIANKISADARLRSLVLGHTFRISGGNCAQGTVVGRAKNEPVFPTLDAMEAHQLVFGVTGQNEVVVARRKSYIDFVKDDIQSFQSELPASEQQKLEQYLESVREVERLLASGGLGCPDIALQGFEHTLDNDQEGISADNNNPAFWRYMCDLAVAALQCDSTRQVSLLHSYGCAHVLYEFDGEKKNHHQQVAHQEEDGPFMEKLLRWHAAQVVHIFAKLKSIPEGAGTMADTLLLTWMSDGGGIHHGGTRAHPLVHLGTAGGRLKAGQWLRFQEGQHSLASAHLTTLRAMGVELATFGDGIDPCPGPVPGLLA